ncbi:MAG: hypothetical protein WAU88_00105 [Candidatus Zixiibacteriota bacterium]
MFPGHHFTIVRGKDTAASGVIDESYDGVSIGSGTLPKDGKRNFEKYKALVEVAETEWLSTVRIGVYAGQTYPEIAAPFDSLLTLESNLYIPTRHPDPLMNNALSWDTSDEWDDQYDIDGDTILVWATCDTLDLFDKLDKHLIDAVAMVGESRGRDNFRVQTERGALVVMLIPNLKTDSIKNGLLTKSLSFRFDPSRIQADLTEQCDFVSSFRPMDTSRVRAYPLDPIRGRESYRQILPRPTLVRISTSQLLMPIANYFADVLAREQCKSEIVLDTLDEQYDVGLICKEYKTSSLSDIQDFEYQGEIEELSWPFAKGDHDVVVPQFERLVQLGHAIADTQETAIRDSLYAEGDRLLIRDIGYVPLCRPKFSLIVRPEITGIELTSEGQIIVTHPRRIKLPEVNAGGDR